MISDYMYIICNSRVETRRMEELNRKLKVFVSGDVLGKFNSLFNRINSVQAKMGKFDILFCVGDFFGSDMSQWQAYKNGEKKVPITTYILGKSIFKSSFRIKI